MTQFQLNPDAPVLARSCAHIHNVIHDPNRRKWLSLASLFVAATCWLGFGFWYYHADRAYQLRQYAGADFLTAFEVVGKTAIVTGEDGRVLLSTTAADKLFQKPLNNTSISDFCPQIQQAFESAVKSAKDSSSGRGNSQLITADCSMAASDDYLQVTISAVRTTARFVVVITATDAGKIDNFLMSDEALQKVTKASSIRD